MPTSDAGADADRSTHREAVDKGRGIGEGTAHGLACAERFQRIGAWQNGDKLLAAEPRDHARTIQMRRCRVGEQLEHAVPQGMTEAVVGLLEMIEIEDQHRDCGAAELPVLSQRIGNLEQSAPVEETGQRVGQGIDALLQFLALLRPSTGR